MKDPNMKSPAEWAEELREASGNDIYGFIVMIKPVQSMQLADRMDDLTEALRLLRGVKHKSIENQWGRDTLALLAKYAEQED